MDSQLNPCSHCGGSAKLYIAENSSLQKRWFVACENTQCPTHTEYADTEESARLLWNTGQRHDYSLSEADLDKLGRTASEALRYRIRDGFLTGEWEHCLDRSILEPKAEDPKMPLHSVALVDSPVDAAFIGAVKPRVVVAILLELRDARMAVEQMEKENRALQRMINILAAGIQPCVVGECCPEGFNGECNRFSPQFIKCGLKYARKAVEEKENV